MNSAGMNVVNTGSVHILCDNIAINSASEYYGDEQWFLRTMPSVELHPNFQVST